MAGCALHTEHTDGCRSCKAAERINKAIRDNKIVIASQEKVNTLRPEIEEILEAIGHPEALVTDLSTIRDFDGVSPALQDLVPTVMEDDSIVEVAMKLRNSRRYYDDD